MLTKSLRGGTTKQSPCVVVAIMRLLRFARNDDVIQNGAERNEGSHKMLGITHNVGSLLRRDDVVVSEPQFIQTEDFRAILYRPAIAQIKEQVKEQVREQVSTVILHIPNEMSVQEIMSKI